MCTGAVLSSCLTVSFTSITQDIGKEDFHGGGRMHFHGSDVIGCATFIAAVPLVVMYMCTTCVLGAAFRLGSNAIQLVSFTRKPMVQPGDGHALVSGASGGIGKEIAHQLAQKGYNLVLVSNSLPGLELVATELTLSYKRNDDEALDVHVIYADLTSEDGVAGLIREMHERSLDITILVNNAGIGHLGEYLDTHLDEQISMVELNVVACLKLMHSCIPDMVAKGRGHVMNVSSLSSFSPCPKLATYCGTKAFVRFFGHALSYELRNTGVSVTTVCPGFTRTDLLATARVKHARVLKLPCMVESAASCAKTALHAMFSHRSLVITGSPINRLLAASLPMMPSEFQCWLANFWLTTPTTPKAPGQANTRA